MEYKYANMTGFGFSEGTKMNGTYIDSLTNILAYLEMGHAINPTSAIHAEFKNFVLGDLVTEEALAARIQAFKDDGVDVLEWPFC